MFSFNRSRQPLSTTNLLSFGHISGNLSDSSSSCDSNKKARKAPLSQTLTHRKKSSFLGLIQQKQIRVGNPMDGIGIMTLNNHIPYKKPVLKQMVVFVNAKGVLHELEQKHGGLYSNTNRKKNDQIQMQLSQKKESLTIKQNHFIDSNMKRIRSAKPGGLRSILFAQNFIDSPCKSRPLSPNMRLQSTATNFYKSNQHDVGSQ